MPYQAAYCIPCLPDLSLSKYSDHYESISLAKSNVESAVYEFVRLLTYFYPPEKIAVTLRYAYSPQSDPLSRLSIFLLVYIAEPDGHESQRLALAEKVLQKVLLFDRSIEKLDIQSTADILSSCSNVCLIFQKENFEEIDLELPHVQQRYLYHIYTATDFGDIEFDWDLFFDQIEEPLVLDFSFFRVNSSKILDALREELKNLNFWASGFYSYDFDSPLQEDFYKEKRSFVASFLREKYNNLLEHLINGPVFAFNIRIAASGNCFNFAKYIASILSHEENFIVQPDIGQKTWDSLYTGKPRTFYTSKWNCYSIILPKQLYILKNIPNDISERWKILSRLVHIFPHNVAKQILRLPVFINKYPKTCRLESEFLYSYKSIEKKNTILVGEIVDRLQASYISTKQINKHIFVAGVTGSGKTTTIMEILIDLAEKGIPFLVIEPSKKEYRKLIKIPSLKNNLRIFTCGNDTLNPLKLNPFEFDFENVTLDEHLSLLESCFRGTLPLLEPLPELLMEAVEEAYRSKGWFGDSSFQLEFPTIKDVEESLPKVFQRFRYSDQFSADAMTALKVRLSSLNKRIIGSVLNTKKTIPSIKELLQQPTIIELDRISGDHANLIAFYLLLSINQYLKIFPSTHDLKYVLVIEEAHNLIGRSSKLLAPGEADPQTVAAQFMVKMLAEVRALGMGLIIADQTPSAVAPEVLKNTGVKIVHRTVAGEDREVLAESMLLDERQKEDLARLQTGYCYLYHEDLYKPQKIKISLNKTLVDNKPVEEISDSELKDILIEGKIKEWANYIEKIKQCINYLENLLCSKRIEDVVQEDVAIYEIIKDALFGGKYKKCVLRLDKEFKQKGYKNEYYFYIKFLDKLRNKFLKIKEVFDRCAESRKP